MYGDIIGTVHSVSYRDPDGSILLNDCEIFEKDHGSASIYLNGIARQTTGALQNTEIINAVVAWVNTNYLTTYLATDVALRGAFMTA